MDVDPDDGLNGYWIMRLVPTDPPQLVTFGMNFDDLSDNIGFMRSNDMGRTWELFGPELRNRFIDSFGVSSDGQVIYANERDVYFRLDFQGRRRDLDAERRARCERTNRCLAGQPQPGAVCLF